MTTDDDLRHDLRQAHPADAGSRFDGGPRSGEGPRSQERVRGRLRSGGGPHGVPAAVQVGATAQVRGGLRAPRAAR